MIKCKCGKQARVLLEDIKLCFKCYYEHLSKQKDTAYCPTCGRGIYKEENND